MSFFGMPLKPALAVNGPVDRSGYWKLWAIADEKAIKCVDDEFLVPTLKIAPDYNVHCKSHRNPKIVGNSSREQL
jgi:hypothetical protein